MTRFHLAVAALIILLYTYTQAPAATNAIAPVVHTQNYELVVVEVPGCIYCGIFRRDVAPSYEASPRARTVPMRFVDLNEQAAEKLQLAAPVDVVPTVLLIENGHEIGRIAGYTGPENFFHTVNALLGAVE